MAKKETVFFCQQCGYESPKWMGQCPSCKEWNSFVEETFKAEKGKRKAIDSIVKVVNINDVEQLDGKRVKTGMAEFDRVLGGGLVKGSLILIGGDPGIGKSTILLQVCRNLANDSRKVLYISGEESVQQIKLRADRIGTFTDELRLACETSLTAIENMIENEKPQFVVIDSIQTMYGEDVNSAPGSVSQVREATNTFLRIAKSMDITIFLVGHVTKEGAVAGPRVLEHMVDTVLYF
nr:AAA family ATPase [Lachnospiraceae bacterium]